jgi:hypothetical protein
VLPPPRRGACTSNALAALESGAAAEQTSQAEMQSDSSALSGRGPGSAPDSHVSTVWSKALMKSEASMLASFSSSKTICEMPKLDLFSLEDEVRPVKGQNKEPQEKDGMQLRDVGHDTYRCQLGSVATAVAGDTVTTENNPVSLLVLMDEEADEV